MIFKSIRITEGMYYRYIQFSDKANLIYSVKNSTGKTTLLRFLLHSLGYAIPSTKKIKFEKCTTETIIATEHAEYRIIRNNDYLEVYTGDNKKYYVLPSEMTDFHLQIFNTDNLDILNNILGAIYVDQEKGWTLLNRGIAIGKIHFNIEQLVRGLSNRDCTDLVDELASTKRELAKYKQMFSVAEYQKSINELQDNLVYENRDDELKKEITLLQLERQNINKELKRINEVIDQNQSFKKYIEKMQLTVLGPNNEEIPVNADTLIGFNDNIHFLLTKRRMLLGEISSIENNLHPMEKELNEAQLSIKSQSLIQSFDREISNMQIDAVTVKKIIDKLEKEQQRIKKALSDATKYNNDVITNLHKTIMKYASELEFEDYVDPRADYIFTDDLKSLSGAILHMIVFAFRLAYIKALEEKLNTKLPIILDSPSGREVTRDNVEKMIHILNRDFSDNQIILASVFNYDMDNLNHITIQDKLIDVPMSDESH